MGLKERRLVKAELEALGMSEGPKTKKGHIFTGPDGWVVPVSTLVTDSDAKHVIHNARKHYGATTVKGSRKRDPEAARDRAEAERNRLAAERAARKSSLREFIRERELALKEMPDGELDSVLQEIERREAEIREIERLMTEIPAGGDHVGRRRVQRHS